MFKKAASVQWCKHTIRSSVSKAATAVPVDAQPPSQYDSRWRRTQSRLRLWRRELGCDGAREHGVALCRKRCGRASHFRDRGRDNISGQRERCTTRHCRAAAVSGGPVTGLPAVSMLICRLMARRSADGCCIHCNTSVMRCSVRRMHHYTGYMKSLSARVRRCSRQSGNKCKCEKEAYNPPEGGRNH